VQKYIGAGLHGRKIISHTGLIDVRQAMKPFLSYKEREKQATHY
jgi:hypothetical protein